MDPHNERCTELQYPDLVNFSVSVYVRYIYSVAKCT